MDCHCGWQGERENRGLGLVEEAGRVGRRYCCVGGQDRAKRGGTDVLGVAQRGRGQAGGVAGHGERGIDEVPGRLGEEGESAGVWGRRRERGEVLLKDHRHGRMTVESDHLRRPHGYEEMANMGENLLSIDKENRDL